MLRIDRDVAWLRLGSCTDHVISAAAATPEQLSSPRPASSRRRRAKASRIDAGNWPTRGMTRSIAGMLMGPRDLEMNKWIEALADDDLELDRLRRTGHLSPKGRGRIASSDAIRVRGPSASPGVWRDPSPEAYA